MDKQKTTKAQEMHAVEMMIGYILRIGVIASDVDSGQWWLCKWYGTPYGR